MIVRALFDRAEGYSHEVSRTTLYRGKEQTVTNTVSYPPDTQARMFWLRNRQRHYWRARAEAAPEWEPGQEAVDPPGGGARCRRRERAPCRRARVLTWQTLAEIAEIPADAALHRKDDMRKRGLASPDDGDALALTFAYPVAKRDWAAPVKALRGEEYELSGVGAFTCA